MRGGNGCHSLLAGINILLGLKGETPETLEKNFNSLKRMLDDGLLVRRINIRQVVPYPGTKLFEECTPQDLKKNRHLYKDWVNKVRHEIDLPMLKRLFPAGTVLKDLYCETHEGNVSFLRQLGSYPIVVGVRKRLALKEKFNVRVTGHMLRSLEAEVI
jgi:radical SAM superfamily enzyme with C-terminal helix-hairpin-helix motif